jgi:hypothetical protein
MAPYFVCLMRRYNENPQQVTEKQTGRTTIEAGQSAPRKLKAGGLYSLNIEAGVGQMLMLRTVIHESFHMMECSRAR